MQYYRVLLHGRYFVIPSFTTRPWSQSGSDSQFASWLTVSLPAADVNICYRSLSLIWNLKALKFNSNVSVYCSRCCFPNTHWFLFPYYWSLMHNIFLDGELRLFFLTRKKKKTSLIKNLSLHKRPGWDADVISHLSPPLSADAGSLAMLLPDDNHKKCHENLMYIREKETEVMNLSWASAATRLHPCAPHSRLRCPKIK